MTSPWLRRLLTRSSLAAGWARVEENGGAPGADGVSIRAFTARLEAEFTALQHEVLAGSYRPEPLLSVWLEQPGKKRRELGIPAVRDRVLQSACALLIGPTLEANFEDCSFAYRQGRSVKQAVARVERLRDEGFRWVVDADINSYFDEIPHEPLLRELSLLIPDRGLSALVRQWLVCPIRRSHGIDSRTRGIAQGSPLSPLLANLYLDQLDEAILGENLRLVRFADDFLILCRRPEQAEQALELTRSVLTKLELRLNPAKTRIAHFNDGFRFLGTLFVRSLAVPSKFPLDPAVISSAFAPKPVVNMPAQDERHAVLVSEVQPEEHTHENALTTALSDALDDHPEWRINPHGEDAHTPTLEEASPVRKEEVTAQTTEPLSELLEISSAPDLAEASLDDDSPPLDELDTEELAEPANSPTAVSNALLQTLYVIEPGSEVAREGERFLVKKAEAILIELPATKIDMICLFGRIHITTAAMQLALLRGIPVALIGRNGHYYGRIEPPQVGNIALQRAQFLATDDETFRLEMSRAFIRGKLDNAAIVLQRLARTQGEAVKATIPHLRQLSAQVKTVKALDGLRGLEGAAASAYFEAWRTLLPGTLGFTRRQSRPAPDTVNALLSLGYTILYQNVAALLAARGLNAHIGIMHVSGGTHLALASDLMEELRPSLVDSVVLNLLLNNRLPEPIATIREQVVTLSPTTVRAFLTAFETRLAQRAQYLSGEATTDWRRLIDLQVRRLAQAVRTRDAQSYSPIRMR